uniref:Uncharacterized protein n=1 Tax=Anguilla anguilla TaxID=7936 RepID=A0A0E9XK78_ANGAN
MALLHLQCDRTAPSVHCYGECRLQECPKKAAVFQLTEELRALPSFVWTCTVI